MEYNIKYNKEVSVEDFQSVRSTTNFVEYADCDMHKALNNSLHVVGVYDQNNQPIGIGRIVGDGAVAFFIKDVVVIPSYQCQGIGHLIMTELLKFIGEHAVPKAYVGLMSTKNNEPFYERYGFIRRPNEELGSGMIMYYDKK